MKSTTAGNPRTAPRTEEMAVIHRIFRQGFPQIAGLVRRTPPAATARAEVIAAHLDFLLNGLHNHHTGEDENIWPRLLERAAPQAELIDRMEKQHEAVAERSSKVRTTLAAWRVAPVNGEELATALDEFTQALVEHLDDEEANVVPLLRAHIEVDEWRRFGEVTFEKFTDEEKLIATGSLEDVATPEEAAWFTGELPLPIKLMWRLLGRRRYRRYIARVRGTAVRGPVLRRLLRNANRLAVWLYRRSGGRIGGTAKGLPVLLITTPGRKTGKPHTIPVAYFETGDGYLVTGSAGGTKSDPQWFRNLRAATRVQIQIGNTQHEAEPRVSDAANRDRLWQDVVLARAPFFTKYEEKSGRLIPVAVLSPLP
ncbi:nitroreductase/quinone reductase family protein [Kribbella catacumbae]|uniref:nitroreductase/quinone reductase family protein n=1 Tax=Kribbella catacumbae TaxID=460086 RepID=UPI000370B245|nr:nitroreductase/quinone reductase family protein [Kribbella catacumbae]